MNTVTLSYTDNAGGAYPDATDTDVDRVQGTTATAPDMVVSKDDGLDIVDAAGQQVTYQINFANNGTGDAVNVVIRDILPAGAALAGCSDGCSVIAGTDPVEVEWPPIALVAAGTGGTFTITVDLPAIAPPADHVNSVVLSYTDSAGGAYPDVTDTDVDRVLDPTAPNLVITKDDGLDIVSSDGQEVTYQIVYTNTGGGDAISSVIRDTLPAGATFVRCSDSCSVVTGTEPVVVEWPPIDIIAPGASGTRTITVQLPAASPPTQHLNRVAISYTDTAGNTYPDAVATDVDNIIDGGPLPSVTPPGGFTPTPGPGTPSATPDPLITPTATEVPPLIRKSVDPTFAGPGDEVIWTIEVRNPNDLPIKDITIVDDIPAQLIIIEVISPIGKIRIEGQRIQVDIRELGPNQILRITVRTRVVDDVSLFEIRNRAVLTTPLISASAQARLVIAEEQPPSGETPLWAVRLRQILIAAIFIGMISVTIAFSREHRTS